MYMEAMNATEEKARASVTVIITIWKRQYLREQLDALLEQTVLPEEIWIIHYESHVDIRSVVDEYLPVFPAIFVIQSDLNLKYFGRFSIAKHVNSEFVWLLDDDVIPGKSWLERSCKKCRELNAVISCTGRIVPKDDFLPELGRSGDLRKYFVGDCYNDEGMNYCPADTQVDFACNSYFIQSGWITDFWAIWPSTFLSGEDIHLSASLKVTKNINTVVLEQSSVETSGNLKKDYSRDEHSSWIKPGFVEVRETILRHMIGNCGWRPILWS
jgi:GT2 family glycosyltransferase